MIGVRYTNAPTPDFSGRLVIGLDTWVWREFGQAERTGHPLFLPALRTIEERVTAGDVVVPLAATVYFEIEGKSRRLRREVSEVADRLSGWATFLPPDVRLRHEVDFALRERYGRPLILPDKPPSVGWGVHFSLTGQVQRLALRGTDRDIADFVKSRGAAAVQAQLERFERWGEKSFMAGPATEQETQHLRDEYGYRPEASREVAIERQNRHLRMQAALARDADLRSRPEDLVNASELGVEVNDIINERLGLAGIGVDEFLSGGAAGLSEFLDELPSSVVRRAILRRAVTDRRRAFDLNDVGDADLYAAIVPASDIVIAEKAAMAALGHSTVTRVIRTEFVGGKQLPSLQRLIETLLERRRR